jgi:hypothetical protein
MPYPNVVSCITGIKSTMGYDCVCHNTILSVFKLILKVFYNSVEKPDVLQQLLQISVPLITFQFASDKACAILSML